jgi:3-aminobutyryl-CoA ammonia-lyase
VKEAVSASLRLRLSQADARYGGGLVAGGRVMELFGDVATELCIRCDGDEGLLAGYSAVAFKQPLFAGDFVEVRGEITRMGGSSRDMRMEVVRYARPRPDVSDSAADMVEEPEIVAVASATCVVKSDRQRRRADRAQEGSGS